MVGGLDMLGGGVQYFGELVWGVGGGWLWAVFRV